MKELPPAVKPYRLRYAHSPRPAERKPTEVRFEGESESDVSRLIPASLFGMAVRE